MPQPIYALRLMLVRIDEPQPVLTTDLLSPLDGEEAQMAWTSEITKVVTRKLWEKQLKGAVEHRFVMAVGDGKMNALVEAQAEALDLAQYLEKAIGETG